MLASSIGHDIAIDEVLAIVKTCRLNLVVIDFAWITYHWNRTDQRKVQDLCRQLREAKVEVAAMYRPRALRASDANIHYAQDKNGAVAPDHLDLCFAQEDSAAWAARWGEQILSSLPSVSQIVLYNLRPSCTCPRCRNGRAKAHIEAFLLLCRDRWMRLRPGIRIGHVGVGDEYLSKLDFCWPFLPVNRSDDVLDPDDYVDQITRLQTAHPDRPITPLLKICWASATDNDSADIVRALRACEKSRLGYVLWYYEWIFHSENHRYDPKILINAMGGEWATVSGYLNDKHNSKERP